MSGLNNEHVTRAVGVRHGAERSWERLRSWYGWRSPQRCRARRTRRRVRADICIAARWGGAVPLGAAAEPTSAVTAIPGARGAPRTASVPRTPTRPRTRPRTRRRHAREAERLPKRTVVATPAVARRRAPRTRVARRVAAVVGTARSHASAAGAASATSTLAEVPRRARAAGAAAPARCDREALLARRRMEQSEPSFSDWASPGGAAGSGAEWSSVEDR